VDNPAARDVAAIRNDSNLEYIQLPPYEWQKICIGFNARRGPFTSHSLRQAACYAIDREKITKIMGFGVARVHQYPWISKGQPGWAPEAWPDYSFNPDKAKALLEKDHPNGVEVELFNISREPDNTFAELVKAMWDKVGIRTQLKSLERLGWIESMRKDTFQAGFWSAASYMGAFIRPKLLSGAKGNWGQYKNPEVDKLLNEHVQTMDRAKRHEIMKNVLKIVYDSAELTSVYAITQAVGTHKKVKGLRTYWRYLAAGEVWMDA
jgi:peptide/nickel transport system substrate-binding protein